MNLRRQQPASFRQLVCVILYSAAAVLLAGCNSTFDTDGAYPNRPIKLIVPFGAGGGTDNFARIMKKAIEDNNLLPQPLVIINIDGAGATIGSRRVKNAKPDGYTVLLLHDAIITAQASRKVNYGPDDFEVVAGTGEVGMVITVNANSKYDSLTDLMKDAKDRPDTVTFGANLGALTHYAGLQLEGEYAGARFRFAQIGGGAKRFADLKGGHIDVTGFSIEEFVRFRDEGLCGLAYFGAEPHPAADDVATATEQGFNVISTNTFYWWVPKNTPRDRIDAIAKALERAMETPYVKQKMADIHCEPFFLASHEAQPRITKSTAQFERVAPRKITTIPNIPAIIGAATVGIFALVLFQWITAARQPVGVSKSNDAKSDFAARPGRAFSAVVVTIIYVLTMHLGWLSYLPATFMFIVSIGALLTQARRRSLPVLIAIALVTATSIYVLFTKQFVVDLP